MKIKQSKIRKIEKRDGRLDDFDSGKILNAILKAANSGGREDRDICVGLANLVIDFLEKTYNTQNLPTVEDVQNTVETILMNSGHNKTAKAYILYREQRKKIRDTKEFLLGVKDDIKLSINAVKVLEGLKKEN